MLPDRGENPEIFVAFVTKRAVFLGIPMHNRVQRRAFPDRGRANAFVVLGSFMTATPPDFRAMRYLNPIRPTTGAVGRGPAPLRGSTPGQNHPC